MKLKDLLFQLSPFLLLLVVFFVSKNELVVAVITLAALLLTFKLKYYRNEWFVFLAGVAAGLIFELGGDLIYKLQYWESGSLFGIPFWLPLFWGYGFVLIGRIRDFIVKK